MQSWCPEPFAAEEARVVGAADGEREEFAAANPAVAAETPRFRSETGFADASAILDHMTQQERAVVFELVELDVAQAYEQRERTLRDELEAARAQESEELRRANEQWAARFRQQREEDLRALAAASARLAVDIAEKIVRRRIEADPGVLVRALETALHAAEAGGGITVTVAPADAEWLDAQDGLRERLGIERVVADPRLERGGCRVTCGGREWNATLRGQLETIGEVVDEWLATAGERAEPEPGTAPLGDPVD